MNNITTASIIRYLPRNTSYTVLQHNILIKDSNDSWQQGCLYKSLDEDKYFARPYSLFNEESWEILETMP